MKWKHCIYFFSRAGDEAFLRNHHTAQRSTTLLPLLRPIWTLKPLVIISISINIDILNWHLQTFHIQTCPSSAREHHFWGRQRNNKNISRSIVLIGAWSFNPNDSIEVWSATGCLPAQSNNWFWVKVLQLSSWRRGVNLFEQRHSEVGEEERRGISPLKTTAWLHCRLCGGFVSLVRRRADPSFAEDERKRGKRDSEGEDWDKNLQQN